MARRTASLGRAIEWIAHNDETGEADPEEVAKLISVCLVADLWGRTPVEVAARVLKYRREIEDEALQRLEDDSARAAKE